MPKGQMEKYKIINKNRAVLSDLMKQGLISTTLIRNADIFNNFRELRAEKISKEICYIKLSESWKLSYDQIKRIVLSMLK